MNFTLEFYISVGLFLFLFILMLIFRSKDNLNRNKAKQTFENMNKNLKKSSDDMQTEVEKLEEIIATKQSQVKELIATLTTQMQEIQSYSNDMAALRVSMKSFKDAIEALAKLTEETNGRIYAVEDAQKAIEGMQGKAEEFDRKALEAQNKLDNLINELDVACENAVHTISNEKKSAVEFFVAESTRISSAKLDEFEKNVNEVSLNKEIAISANEVETSIEEMEMPF